MSKTEDQNLALRLQAVIETAIDGIITIDDRGIIETMNLAAAGLFEYEPSEVIGKNVKILMNHDHRDKHDGYLHRYNTTKEARIIGIGREVHGRTKSGRSFPFRLAVSEVILNNRIIFTGIIHDLTDVKEAQRKITDLNRQLEAKVSERTFELEKVVNKLLETNTTLESEIKERKSIEEKLLEQESELRVLLNREKELNSLKSRFVSMASHEFRTPLTSILSSAELLSKYTQTEQQSNREKHVHRIKNAVNNLTAILNDFLSLSKLEEGKSTVKLEDVHINQLLEEIKDETSLITKENQSIIIENKLVESSIQSDKHILKNILFNLISNAIKYSSKDIYVQIEAKEKIEIRVIDQGIGIPAEEQKHLFTRFFRSSNVTNIQGTGLGLTIVKRYLDLLQGDIDFKSVFGEGSTFSIYLKR